MSPVLAGRFFTSEPLGKPPQSLLPQLSARSPHLGDHGSQILKLAEYVSV